MSTQSLSSTKRDLESKKRKASIETENTKRDAASYLKVTLKAPKPLLMLKRSACASSTAPNEVVHLMDAVCAGLSVIYLCLMVHVSLDRDHVERCRVVLNWLFLSIKLAYLCAVIMLCEVDPEHFNQETLLLVIIY